MKTIIALAAALLFALTVGYLAYAPPAQCSEYGCARVPCFRNGPGCMGNCTCQWTDAISGFCG